MTKGKNGLVIILVRAGLHKADLRNIYCKEKQIPNPLCETPLLWKHDFSASSGQKHTFRFKIAVEQPEVRTRLMEWLISTNKHSLMSYQSGWVTETHAHSCWCGSEFPEKYSYFMNICHFRTPQTFTVHNEVTACRRFKLVVFNEGRRCLKPGQGSFG